MDYTILVKRLLQEYTSEHEAPIASHQQRTREEYEALNECALQCARWIQQNTPFPVHFYQIISRNGKWYDTLLVDGRVVFSNVRYAAMRQYLLNRMENHDLVQEQSCQAFPLTGAQYRFELNEIERDDASDGTVLPTYCYGPGEYSHVERFPDPLISLP